tara:strand:+ start:545 stop:694 length:150 start_codon:yes stop_codon:yes gene_type:complete
MLGIDGMGLMLVAGGGLYSWYQYQHGKMALAAGVGFVTVVVAAGLIGLL